jgi:hypothetical protein
MSLSAVEEAVEAGNTHVVLSHQHHIHYSTGVRARGRSEGAGCIILPVQNIDSQGGVEALEEGETADGEGEGDALKVEFVEPIGITAGSILMASHLIVVEHREHGISIIKKLEISF